MVVGRPRSVEKLMRPGPKPVAFLDRVDPEPNSGCLLWQGALNQRGYGLACRNGRTQGVHRLVYEDVYGPIPSGLTIDHLCRVRSCINVRHMEVVTSGVNVLRGMARTAVNARKRQCPKGHEYRRTPENVKRQYRYCHICKMAWQRASRVRKDVTT